MARVLVAGGGIAGLVAARSLARTADVVLVETADRLGGKLVTTSFRGRPLDLGPDSFITRDRAAIELCEELGLGDELVAPASRSAAIFANGALGPLPGGLVIGIPTDLDALARSGLLTRREARRALLDRAFPTRMSPGAHDETVAEIVRPRLGDAVLERLVDPLIGGINASDVEVLSFAAALPQLVDAVTGRRSLTRALRPLTRRPAGEGPVFYGLRRGLAALVERLAAHCRDERVELRTGVELVDLAPTSTGASTAWHAKLADGEELRTDAVVLALPAPAAAQVLRRSAPALADELAQIEYASVATVTLAWRTDTVPPRLSRALGGAEALPGSGVLLARSPERLVTAATFTSTKWPHCASEGEIVVRASVGRHRDERALALDDRALTLAVRAELAGVLGLDDEPLETLVARWPDSFPQYVVGHLARVARIEALAGALPGLRLAGAALRGIGIPACIRGAAAAAAAIEAHLAKC